MELLKLGDMEQRFADLIWEKQPIPTKHLTELCAEQFEWKRTTTYTMLKRLCNRGIFINKNGVVSALMEKSDFQAAQGESFINETFNGSLPQFIAAFTRRKPLSHQEISELQKLIDAHQEEKP